MTHPLQVSGKCGDVIVVIGGTDPANFQDNVLSILGEDGAAAVADAFKVALVDRVQQAILTNAADVVFAAGMASAATHATSGGSGMAAGMATPQSSVTSPSVPATQAENVLREETDKWGSVWTYNVPGAPSCPHGPRVQKKATSQAGKPYVGWCCPTTSPFAYRQKITKADCKMEFAK